MPFTCIPRTCLGLEQCPEVQSLYHCLASVCKPDIPSLAFRLSSWHAPFFDSIILQPNLTRDCQSMPRPVHQDDASVLCKSFTTLLTATAAARDV